MHVSSKSAVEKHSSTSLASSFRQPCRGVLLSEEANPPRKPFPDVLFRRTPGCTLRPTVSPTPSRRNLEAFYRFYTENSMPNALFRVPLGATSSKSPSTTLPTPRTPFWPASLTHRAGGILPSQWRRNTAVMVRSSAWRDRLRTNDGPELRDFAAASVGVSSVIIAPWAKKTRPRAAHPGFSATQRSEHS